DGFGEFVLGAHAVFIPEKLEEADAAFEDGGAIAEGAFDGLPEAEAFAFERNGAGAGDPFPGGASIAEVVGEAPIEEHDDDVAFFVEVPAELDISLVKDVPA